MRKKRPVDQFDKYGLRFTSRETVCGPPRPSLYGNTPKLLPFGGEGNVNLSPIQNALEESFCKNKPLQEKHLRLIVSEIFKSVTGQPIKNYSNFIFMPGQDWQEFQKHVTPSAGKNANYDGINLGGLIVMRMSSSNAMVPVLFHEAGHSLYYPMNNLADELRAYYFQERCTAIFLKALKKIGLIASYPPPRDEQLPTPTHAQAYSMARALYGYHLGNMLDQANGKMPTRDTPYDIKMKEWEQYLGPAISLYSGPARSPSTPSRSPGLTQQESCHMN